jgi:hypothetical protein
MYLRLPLPKLFKHTSIGLSIASAKKTENLFSKSFGTASFDRLVDTCTTGMFQFV